MEVHSSPGGQAEQLATRWKTDPRWAGVRRAYTAEEVVRLRGSVHVEHSLARHGAERLWELLHDRDYVHALGAMTGGQAVQMVKAGRRRSTCRAGRSPAMRTCRSRSTPTRACTRRTAPRPWSGASTTPCGAPTRSTCSKARATATGSCRSWRTPRRASADRWPPTS